MVAYWILVLLTVVTVVVLMFLGISTIANTNILFTKVIEGTGRLILAEGKLDKIIINAQKSSCIINQYGDYEIVEQEPLFKAGFIGFLERKFGIYWVGIPPWFKVWADEFVWGEWKEEKDTKGKVIGVNYARRKEKTDFFFARPFPYAIPIKNAEMKGGMRGNMDMMLTITIVFPAWAFFRTEDWFVHLESRVIEEMNKYIKDHTWEELGSNTASQSIPDYVLGFNGLAYVNGVRGGGILGTVGAKICEVSIRSIELSDESKKDYEATTAIDRAQRYAKAEEAKAEGDANATRKRKQGEADGLLSVAEAEAKAISTRMTAITKHGEIGKFILKQDTLAKVGEGASNTIVIASGDVDEKQVTASVITGQTIAQAMQKKS